VPLPGRRRTQAQAGLRDRIRNGVCKGGGRVSQESQVLNPWRWTLSGAAQETGAHKIAVVFERNENTESRLPHALEVFTDVALEERVAVSARGFGGGSCRPFVPWFQELCAPQVGREFRRHLLAQNTRRDGGHGRVCEAGRRG